MSDKYRIRIEQNGEGLTDYIVYPVEEVGIFKCMYEYVISNKKILNQYEQYGGDILSFINDKLKLETHSERISK
tara:strand:+ start:536 stop:757 length:222 start_codon:yes stop_codon:yes gene_type:complete